MRSRKTWQIGLLALALAGLLGSSELKDVPILRVQNPTSLYLLAEFKAVVGDRNSGLELLDRALEAGESPARPAAAMVACNLASRVSAH